MLTTNASSGPRNDLLEFCFALVTGLNSVFPSERLEKFLLILSLPELGFVLCSGTGGVFLLNKVPYLSSPNVPEL